MRLEQFALDVYPNVRIDCGRLAHAQVVCASRQLTKQLGRDAMCSDLCEQVIMTHMRWMRDNSKSTATINRRRVHFLTLWKLVYKAGLNNHDYFRADIPTVRNTIAKPIAWSISEISQMVEAAESAKQSERNPFSPQAWRSLILLCYYTGLRIRAVLQLRRLNLHGRVLIVPAEIQKDRTEQVFRLPNDLVHHLISLPKTGLTRLGRELDSMLIPWPWRLDCAAKMLNKYILKPAGLPDNRHLKFHAIRKTVGTIVAAERGEDVARKALGHSSISVTRRYIADGASVSPNLPQEFSPVDVMPKIG